LIATNLCVRAPNGVIMRARYTPLETGLERFVAYDKAADFIGKAAVLAEREQGAARKLCTFEVDAGEADAVAWEPIWPEWIASEPLSEITRPPCWGGFLPLANANMLYPKRILHRILRPGLQPRSHVSRLLGSVGAKASAGMIWKLSPTNWADLTCASPGVPQRLPPQSGLKWYTCRIVMTGIMPLQP